MAASTRGTFVISWSQTELDGLDAPPVGAMAVGAAWSWRGDAVYVNGATDALKLDDALRSEDVHQRAAQIVHRLVGVATGRSYRNGAGSEPFTLTRNFVVTNGAQTFTVTLIDIGQGQVPLLMFVDDIPPRDTELWVVDHTIFAVSDDSSEPNTRGVICFTAGTRIATPTGSVAVEHLRIGDLVSTKDNGPQPVEWIGSRHMSGARFFAMPGLRPVRMRAGALGIEQPDHELLVSPEHRMLISGRIAQDLFNTPEVLVAAKDLIDHQLVVTDNTVSSVTYIHLLLPDHNILWANGVATESFHPANSAISGISAQDRERLFARHPGLAHDPFTYGRFARRNLTTDEAAVLRQAA